MNIFRIREAIIIRIPDDLERFREHDVDALIGSFRLPRTGRIPAGLRETVDMALQVGDGLLTVSETGQPGPGELFSTRRSCPSCSHGFPEPDPRMFSFHSPLGHDVVAFENEGAGALFRRACAWAAGVEPAHEEARE